MEATNEYREQRLASMKALAEMGYDPYGEKYDHEDLKKVREEFVEGKTTRIAGRLLMIRRMGKMNFATMNDGTGKFSTTSSIASGSHTWGDHLENGIWTYSLDASGDATLLGVSQSGGTLIVPEEVEGRSVVAIASGMERISISSAGVMPFDTTAE